MEKVNALFRMDKEIVCFVFCGIKVNAQNGQGFYAVFMQRNGVFVRVKWMLFLEWTRPLCSFQGSKK